MNVARQLRAVELRKDAFKEIEFGHVHGADITVVRVMNQIVLMIILGVIEFRSGNNLCGDRVAKEFCVVQLGYVSVSNSFLLRRSEENGRAVLCTDIRTLAIFLCGVMSDAEEDHEQLAVGDFRRIINDADAFRVARGASANQFVIRMIDVAAAIAGGDFSHAVDVFEYGLGAPEAAASKDGNLCGGFLGERLIYRRSWNRPRGGVRYAGDALCDVPNESHGDGESNQGPSESRWFEREFHWDQAKPLCKARRLCALLLRCGKGHGDTDCACGCERVYHGSETTERGAASKKSVETPEERGR